MLHEFTLNGFGNYCLCTLLRPVPCRYGSLFSEKNEGKVALPIEQSQRGFAEWRYRELALGCLKSWPEDTATSLGGEVSFESFIKGQGWKWPPATQRGTRVHWEEPFQEMTQDSDSVTKIFTNTPNTHCRREGARRTRGRFRGETDRGRDTGSRRFGF